MDALTILVPLFTAMLGYAVGYYVKKAEYERQRRDDLADRDFNRRAAIYDMRIQEAREYVGMMSIFLENLEQVTRILKESNGKSEAESEFEYYGDTFLSISSKMSELSTKRASIEILNDEEIKNLFKEVRLQSPSSLDQFMAVIDKLYKEEDDIEFRKLKEGIEFGKIEDALRNTNKIFTKIKARLDKLAQTVP
jgi:hypothetical protein